MCQIKTLLILNVSLIYRFTMHGGTRRKIWTRTKILSPNIRYFVANFDLSRFTHFFLEIFGSSLSYKQEDRVFGHSAEL